MNYKCRLASGGFHGVTAESAIYPSSSQLSFTSVNVYGDASFDSTNGVLSCLSHGFYELTLLLEADIGDTASVTINRNGQALAAAHAGNTVYVSTSMTSVISECDPGDEFTFECEFTAWLGCGAAVGTTFQAQLINTPGKYSTS